MKKPKKPNTPWIEKDYSGNYTGKFKINSCKGAEAYLEHKTGIKCQVHKTERYLVVTYVVNGSMAVEKIELPGHVLYCLHEKDFEPLISKLTKKEENAI
jgi:hypothetical protein